MPFGKKLAVWEPVFKEYVPELRVVVYKLDIDL